jgi:hypothetical protein
MTDMTKRLLTLGTFAALAIGLTTFTGSAMAGNGNGATPPGQEKKADQAAPAAQPAAQPAAAAPSTPPGQAKKASAAASPTTSKSPGQAKQAAKASTSTPGVKPSNTTSHWTHCSTGGTATAATCTGNGPKADGSKQYGNGKTAAQIAVSRGAPAGTVLTGPGNSQPHKVTVCGKPNNKSGGVDVHAVKSYSAASCTPPAAQPAQATESRTDCSGTTVTSTTTGTVFANTHGKVKLHGNAGVHGKHKGLVAVPATVVTSTFAPGNTACGSTSTAGTTGTAAATPGTGATATATPAAAGMAPASAPAATAAAGGVLGAQATLVRPAAKSAGGVLGATSRLGAFAVRGTLPFTGLPLWIAAVVALVLIAAGLSLRTQRPTRQL